MDPEFQRALLIVLGAGTAIMTIATLVLFLLFRRFGGKGHAGLVAALIGFIFVCCLVLFLVARE